MTGYQESMSDPSYAGQILTFTFPHIGNVGINMEDIETTTPSIRGVVLRQKVTSPSNFRSTSTLGDWLAHNNIPGIIGVDTRKITRSICVNGAPKGSLVHDPSGNIDFDSALEQAISWPGLEGMDLAKEVTTKKAYEWNQTQWNLDNSFGIQKNPKYRVVAIDYGAKHNILRCLATAKCLITVVPATSSYEEIINYKPDGIFLSNGPGDPAATGKYAVPTIKKLLEAKIPIMGICLGHQLLSLAVGAKTKKMHQGHRGANHPVKDVATGRVEITCQNHGFVVDPLTLPKSVEVSHTSLFDGTLEGIKLKDKPAFSVQYHPEASPGPQDSQYLFERFIMMMDNQQSA
jgi:carbamoyl-phosphate synthase small subunit